MIPKIKSSVCITIFDEKKETVRRLLGFLKKQTLKPDEIIIIDAKDYDNCSRAKGRNIAIGKARNEIVAITDAGCVPHKNWLYEITKPFINKNTDVVAGSYKMVAKNSFQKAESIFLGVKNSEMDKNFMPSARSMAFTKTIWKKAGGLPEKMGDTAEDTLFNVELLKVGAKFAVAKKAVVDWKIPETIFDFARKIFNYAKGDAESGIWWHPIKKWRTHNLKILSIFLRYIIFALVCFVFGYRILGGIVGSYLLFSILKAGWWGILLQFISDFAVMAGFLRGIIKLCVRI